MKKFTLLVVVLIFSFSSTALSQIQLTNSGYLQDFNTLADTGTFSDALPDGWFIYEDGSDGDSLYSIGTGSSRTGDTYSFGSEDSTERALGSIRSGTVSPFYGADFINNSGDVITLMHITYTGEQWRAGTSSRTEPDSLKFQYSINATSLYDGDWIDIDQLKFLSPTVGISGVLDGNLQENQSEITYTITGLSIPDGAEFWIRWEDVDVSSYDDGLAIDDFYIDLTAPAVTSTITPFSLHFDTVELGYTNILPVTITNEGATDDLIITNIELSNPVFSIAPNSLPVTLSPGDEQSFDVTFTPANEGLETGTINFTHNAPGSPSSLSLSGTGFSPTSSGLLKFKTSVRDLIDRTKANPDTVLLSGYSGQPLKALQFDLLVGKTNGGLILRSITRGAAIPAGQFYFTYEIYRGDYLPNGSSIDTVKVVILGIGSNTIMPNQGDQEIMNFSYDIVSISETSTQTFNSFSDITGATVYPVTDAALGAGSDETINIFNGTLEGLLGDVNLDNQINILDILLMVDYIIGRVEFNSDQMFNADLSPWEEDAPLPIRDGKIDVLDLAVLQNMVLTGKYPSNSPLYKTAPNPLSLFTGNSKKLTPGMNSKVTFYFTGEGISIGLESLKKVKGLQIELDNLGLSIPQNTVVNSIFNQSLFYQDNSLLRMLSYDDQSASLSAGKYVIASIPCKLNNPGDLVVHKLIVADENNNSMDKIEVEILYEDPNMPNKYYLSQNYPNPFNPVTYVKFSVPKDDFVTIKIYNMIGQEITTLFSGFAKSGTHTLNWDGIDQNGKQVSSGSYIYRMTAGKFNQSKKLIYMK